MEYPTSLERLRSEGKKMIVDLYYKAVPKNEAIATVLERLSHESDSESSKDIKTSFLMELKAMDLPQAYADAQTTVIPPMNDDEVKEVSKAFYDELVEQEKKNARDENTMQLSWKETLPACEELKHLNEYETIDKADRPEEDKTNPSPPSLSPYDDEYFETPKTSRSPKTSRVPKRQSSVESCLPTSFKRLPLETIPFPPLVPPPPPLPPTVHLTTISVYYDPHTEKLCVTTTGSHGI